MAVATNVGSFAWVARMRTHTYIHNVPACSIVHILHMYTDIRYDCSYYYC